METAEYETMFRIEDQYWWYLGLRDLLLPSLQARGAQDSGGLILDAGCGTGKFLETLNGREALGVDFEPEALVWARKRGLRRLSLASVVALPYRDGSFETVVSCDVICDLVSPDDQSALHEFARVLKPGGRLILNLPAFRMLGGEHDEAVHTRQRYRRGELEGMLTRSGFEIELLTYRVTLAFLPALFFRLMRRVLRRSSLPPRSDLRPLPALLNRVLAGMLYAENWLIRRGPRLPFGLSVFGIARKPAGESCST